MGKAVDLMWIEMLHSLYIAYFGDGCVGLHPGKGSIANKGIHTTIFVTASYINCGIMPNDSRFTAQDKAIMLLYMFFLL